MSHPRIRKHYRVANRKSSESANIQGTIIKEKDLHVIMSVGLLLLILSFLKGLVIGYLLRDNEQS